MLPEIEKEKSNAGIKSQKIVFLRRTRRKEGNTGKWLPTVLGTLTAALVLNFGVSAAHRAILQQGIAEEVLRFHVLANSDSEEDQSVKYLVRNAVLEWIHTELNKEKDWSASRKDRAGQKTEMGETDDCETDNAGKATAEKGEEQSDREAAEKGEEQSGRETADGGKEFELRFLAGHISEIEEAADQVLKEQGLAYRAQASVESCYFPARTYGDCTFPAGWYDALRIQLGEAKGHNWWCVLYPGLCFSDCLHAVVDEGELADLKEVLTVEEYESLLRKPEKWKIAFRWF